MEGTDENELGAVVPQRMIRDPMYLSGFPIESAIITIAHRVSNCNWTDIQYIAVVASVVVSAALTLLEAASMESSDVTFSSRIPT